MVIKVILFFIFSMMAWSAPLQYLVRTTESTGTAFDVPGTTTTWAAGDDKSRTVNFGFSFPFNNTTYTQVILNSNGVLNFATSNSAYANTALPGPIAGSIYPYWDDLIRTGGTGADGTIKYGTLGTAGTDLRFAVTWTDVRHYNNTAKRYTFQAVLYESGIIRFRYLDASDANGTRAVADNPGATVGVQESASNFDQYSYDAVFSKALDVVYYPLPIIVVNKSSCVINDPVNGTTNPKRIPGATIRYAVQVSNSGIGTASNVFGTDTLSSVFNTATTPKVAAGACNCATGGGDDSGSVSGANVTINYGTVLKGTPSSPTRECGYFEAVIK